MGKRTLITGVVSGAVIGGIVSLFNSKARTYAKRKIDETRTQITYSVNNPTETVSHIKQSVIDLNEKVSSGTDSTLNALEQVENTLQKVTKRIE